MSIAGLFCAQEMPARPGSKEGQQQGGSGRKECQEQIAAGDMPEVRAFGTTCSRVAEVLGRQATWPKDRKGAGRGAGPGCRWSLRAVGPRDSPCTTCCAHASVSPNLKATLCMQRLASTSNASARHSTTSAPSRCQLLDHSEGSHLWTTAKVAINNLACAASMSLSGDAMATL